MSQNTGKLLHQIAHLEEEIEHELGRARDTWHYRVEQGRIRFEREVRLVHRRLRQSIPAFLRSASIRNILTAPVIYSLLVPLLLLDIWITCYQRICFPIYGIALVRRSRYILFDRHHLAYLNAIEKVNCDYCGYANGVFAYVREVAARTEQYWCPIRHASRLRAPHAHYHEFVDYGDAKGYHKHLPMLRRSLEDER